MLALFKVCYAPVAGGMGVSWQRVGLPDPGGVAAQDAWTLQALDWLRAVYTSLIYERKPAKDPARGERPKR